MRILVFGTNYAPEKTAVAPFTTGLCEHLAAEGHDVTVVTTFPYYPEWRVWDAYRGHAWQKEHIRGVRVIRVRHFVPRRASRLAGRLAHDFTFTLGALFAGLFAGKFDVLYCTCPPPALALAAYALAVIHRRPYVMKLTDLASDAALATGILKEGPAVRVARAIEGFIYRKADRVACLCQGFIEKLAARGVAREKLVLIPDWADTERIHPIAGATAFRAANGLTAEEFVVMHTGNMGKKQDLMNVVRAAEASREEKSLVWLLVGQGEERAAIEEEVRRRKLKNIRLLPLQPVEGLAEMYSAVDALLLNQKAAMEGAVIPSKLLTYMAAGRAVLAAASERSEAARLVLEAQCGLVVSPENPEALVEAARSLRQDAALRERFGMNGRAYASLRFTKQRVLQDYAALFSRYARGKLSAPAATAEAAADR